MTRQRAIAIVAACAASWIAIAQVRAQEVNDTPPSPGGDELASTPPPSEEAEAIPDMILAQLVENPLSGISRIGVGNLISFGSPVGADTTGYGLVLAPLVPALFRGGWSLLTRAIIPAVLTVPTPAGRKTGFGDIASEVLGHKVFSPRPGHYYDIASGPSVGFPSASDDLLGTGRWRLGAALAPVPQPRRPSERDRRLPRRRQRVGAG